MRLDIKLPIGLIFSIIGIILIISGIIDKQKILDKLQFNFNLWWGLMILIFGLAMLITYFIKRKKDDNA